MASINLYILIVTGLGSIIAGLYFYWHIRSSRTIVKINQSVNVFSLEDNYGTLGFEIINDSNHSVTIKEIGIFFDNTLNRTTLLIPIPISINAHDSFSGSFEPFLFKDDNMVHASHVYTKLSNGKSYKKTIDVNPAKERASIQI